MKRLWIAVAILAAVFCATLFHSHYLKAFTGDLTALLTQAETLAEQGQWDGAKRLTNQAEAQWEAQGSYLHILLRHADTDQIHTGFREVAEFINCQEGGEYSAANARLISQIELLFEAEQLNLENVL